jgi:NAD+--asparagine ADP-ribosyltransferase
MSREIDEIKKAAGAYRRWALEARKKYIALRQRQDPEIRGLYIRSADRVGKRLRRLVLGTPSSYLRKRQLKELEKALRAEAKQVTGGIEKVLGKYIEQAVDAGGGYNKAIALNLLKKAGIDISGLHATFASVNRQAVEACWARTKKGLHLSNRIWRQGENYRNAVRDIIQEAVATGQDAATTARMLEQYVRKGKKTLAAQYPEMMKRMGGRIPGDICYEALRLARTEMTAAFGEGTIAAAQASPSYVGIKYILSAAHPMYDICDVITSYDSGLGPGVYAPGDEPVYPFHPNCMCIAIPVHEQPEKFVKRLKKWRGNPDSDKELEDWYNKIYQGKANDVRGRRAASKARDEQKALKTALDRAEAMLIRRKTEKAMVFTDDGTVIFEKSGGKSSVSFELSELGLFKDRIFTHNHPSGTSFSAEDIAFAATWDIKEVRACGKYYRYYLKRPPAGWSGEFWNDTLRLLAEKHNRNVQREFTEKIRKGEITVDRANLEHWHEVWSRVAKEAGLDYGREKW